RGFGIHTRREGPSRRTFGPAEFSRSDADDPLEVSGELALVRESGVRGDIRERKFVVPAQQLHRPFDAAGHDVLMRRDPGGRLELTREVVGAGVNGFAHLRERDSSVSRWASMNSTTVFSFVRGSAPSARRAGGRIAEACRSRWTARR